MPVIFVFVDGIGFGKRDQSNPFLNKNLRFFNEITNGAGLTDEFQNIKTPDLCHISIDANLDVDGLPQSGTGQTSLFTGFNAQKFLGRHFGPFPHSKLRPILESDSIFHKVISFGFSAHFLNAYPDIYFEKSKRKNRWSCTTLMAKSAGLRLNRESDILEGNAITAEITQERWREMLDTNIPEISQETAAERVLLASEKYDFVLYEYYLTDKAGHSKNSEQAANVLVNLDRFLLHIYRNKNKNTHLVISSDHGNLENLTIKTHTRNPVPFFVSGPDSDIISEAESITDVANGLLQLLKMQQSN
ncbi:MAG: alkaline phosphatase family protein [Balneolaceae bacterium]